MKLSTTTLGCMKWDLPTALASYEVTVTMGDTFARDRMQVTVPASYGTITAGAANVTNVATVAGQWTHRTFTAQTNPGGQLRLQFGDAGGDPYWVASAIAIRSAPTTGLTVTPPLLSLNYGFSACLSLGQVAIIFL